MTSLEEFRKNPHVKIPPKSPCANFQSLGIFKNKILFGKEFSPSLSAHPAFRPSLFFPPLPHWATASWPAQPTARPNWPPSSSSRTDTGHARCCRRPASRRLPGRPDASTGREKRPHLIPLHFPPLIGAISPSSIPETGAFNPTIEAPSTPVIEDARPRLLPIKADPTPGEAPHTSNALTRPHRRPSEPSFPSPVSRPSTASRATATPQLSSPARPPPRPPFGRSSRALERSEAELR
jgi:hypothetical protein